MSFNLTQYHIETGDTKDLPDKLNNAMDATALVVNGFITANAVAAAEIDWTASDWHEKTLSADTEFTFSNVNTGYVNAVTLLLDPGEYTPTFPATMYWPLNSVPPWADGRTFLITITYVPSKSKYVATWIEYGLS